MPIVAVAAPPPAGKIEATLVDCILWVSERIENVKSTGNGFIGNLRHIEVDYDKRNYCGHPRQCGIANFGGGELAALYWRAPCNYEEQSDISHSFYDGYLSRADVVLRRSLDHGET